MDKQKKLPAYSIEYLKSYFSINSIVGCTADCKYCFLSPLGISPSKPEKVIDEETLVNEMEKSKFFIPDETVLSLNNRTEPFLNEFTSESTLKIMEILNKRGFRNPVTITTKGRLRKDYVSFIEGLQNINPFILVTYSGLPIEVEPLGHNGQIDTMRNIKSNSKRINLLHQFRPIIPGLNDCQEVLSEVISTAQEYCDCSIVSGLRITEFIRDRILSAGVKLDMLLSPDHKSIDAEFRKKVYEFVRKHNTKYPLFSETSCAISWRLGISDINGYWSKGEKNGVCEMGCPNYSCCYDKRPNPNIKEISGLLKKLQIKGDINLKKDSIFISGSMDQEKRAYLRHKLRFPIKCDSLIKSESERVISP